MRAFVLISAVFAVAVARPDIGLGYQYNTPTAHAGTASRVSVDQVQSQNYEVPVGHSTFDHFGGGSVATHNEYVPPVQTGTRFQAPATTLLTPTAASVSAPSVNFITYADQPGPTASANLLHSSQVDYSSSASVPAFPTLSTIYDHTGGSQLNAQTVSSGFSHGGSTGFNQGVSTGFDQGLSGTFSSGGASHITQGIAHNEEIQLSGRFDGGHHVNVNFPPTRIIQQTKPVVTKHTYVFAAPEDEETISPQEPIVLPPPQTHYKIIFIKAPATTIINSQAGAVAPQKNVKTIVYVLSNKRVIDRTVDVPELPDQKHQKPEVFFIKYKTPTEKIESKAVYETVDQVDGHAAGLSPRVEGQVYEPSYVQNEGLHSEGVSVVSPQQTHTFAASGPSQASFQTVHTGSAQQSKPILTSYDSPLYLNSNSFGSSSGSSTGGQQFGGSTTSGQQFGGSATLGQQFGGSSTGGQQFGGSATSGSSSQFLNTGFGSPTGQANNLEYIPPAAPGGSSCSTC
ncbi:hypothetical protein DMENIID0001_038740 [Sergentomyia squamirostris]